MNDNNTAYNANSIEKYWQDIWGKKISSTLRKIIIKITMY